ncbi:MAG: protein kinase [Deltaproteobacteria bacterium]|nr:protein kinase [Deltaproteobacteria bacterium]
MEQIGEYRVCRLLGEGGMGKVYEAVERLSKRPVAVKVLRDELAHSESGRRQFLTEMEILADLEHPNIVRSLASIEADGKLAMVLEHLEGRTLRDELEARGGLPWTEATTMVMSVAEALVAAHGHQPPVIHRDLKPENIMVLPGGSVKVMDFGVAKLLQELDQTNTQSVGTLRYMSPEQVDARSIDHRADLYSLGLIFYELLAGAPPFQATSPRALLNEQCTAPPPPFSAAVRAELPKGLRQLIFALLDKDRERRPASAAELVARLDPFMPDDGSEPSGRPSSSAITGSPPSRGVGGQSKGQSKGQSNGKPSATVAAAPAGCPAQGAAPAVATWHATAARGAWLNGFPFGSRGGKVKAPPDSAAQVQSSDPPDSGDEPTSGQARLADPFADYTEPDGDRPSWAARLASVGAEGELSPTLSLLLIGALVVIAALVTYVVTSGPAPAEPPEVTVRWLEEA